MPMIRRTLLVAAAALMAASAGAAPAAQVNPICDWPRAARARWRR